MVLAVPSAGVFLIVATSSIASPGNLPIEANAAAVGGYGRVACAGNIIWSQRLALTIPKIASRCLTANLARDFALSAAAHPTTLAWSGADNSTDVLPTRAVREVIAIPPPRQVMQVQSCRLVQLDLPV